MRNIVNKMQALKQLLHNDRRFHQDVGGNAMIFTVIVLFVLVCFFVFTIHIGQRITHRVTMQNAADAAVISGAVWHARGLNTISILNVGMTECLALIIMFKAFDSTLEYVKIAHPINVAVAAACQKYPPTLVPCTIWSAGLKLVKPLLKVIDKLNDGLKKTYEKPSEILWKVMRGLRTVEDGVSYAATVMATLEANKIARMNGADPYGSGELTEEIYAVFWPPLQKLPVEDGRFEEDLCDHTWNGGPGYKNYLCWDSAMDLEILDKEVNELIENLWTFTFLPVMAPPGLIYKGMVKAHYKSLCPSTGASVSGEVPRFTTDCQECRENKGRSEWNMTTFQASRETCDEAYMIEGTEHPSAGTVSFSNGDFPYGNFIPEQENGSGEENSDPVPCKICNLTRLRDRDVWSVVVHELKSCEYSESIDDIETKSENKSDKPLPLVLAKDWKDKVNFTSFVFKDGTIPRGSTFLGFDGNPVLSLNSDMSGELITYGEGGNSKKDAGGRVDIPAKIWSIARAQVYNPAKNEADQDLFNQNWHAKLAPCDLKGLAPSSLKDLVGNANSSFLDRILSGGEDVISEILVH